MKIEWELERHFYNGIDDPRLMEDVARYQEQVSSFADAYRGRIASLSDDEFLDYLKATVELGVIIEKVSMYLGSLMSLDSQNQQVQRSAQKLQKLGAQLEEKLAFTDEEHKAVGHDRFMSLSRSEKFAPYRNYLVQQATTLKYILSEQEELLLIKADAASDNNLYEELTTSFEFPFQGKMMTDDEVRAMRMSHDRQERLEAVRSIASVYSSKERQVVLGNLYSLVCKDGVFGVEARGYRSVMTSRNISEEVSDEAVDGLLAAVADMYPLYHRFLAEKKRMLDIDDFAIHDVFAPVGNKTDDVIPFEKGWDMFMEVIGKVDPQQRVFAQEMADDARISVFPKKGKVSGAYANYGPHSPEIMLLNWTDRPRDVTVLAHEMGHCWHGRLSKAQDPLVYSTPLTLAETASIFNETLMFESLLGAVDEGRRTAMVVERLDDIFATIARQICYTRFERRCHEAFARNEPMTYDDYNAAWVEENVLLYGPDVAIDPELIKSNWSAIPHIFHTPFYCYAYAFGNIISLNLVQQYKQAEDKEAFMRKYHSFLAAGGSERPEDLLMKIFGIKMDEAFYATALRGIEELMEMLKEPVAA